MYVLAVPGEGEAGDRRAAVPQRAGQAITERALARTVEALDNHQPSHEQNTTDRSGERNTVTRRVFRNSSAPEL
jgi:hypothetical protein